ncbi:MAG: FecR domain-containing protein [Pedobacter sp.]|uniref:FecR family protein n=1 Tax=Pedobacter sp. TaxID=1411316 RepID=UPI0035669AE7
MKQPNHIFDVSNLIGKYLRNELSVDEKERLNIWIAESKENNLLFRRITAESFIQEELVRFSAADKSTAWERIKKETQITETVKRKSPLRLIFRYAAVISLLALTITIFKIQQKQSTTNEMIALDQNDVSPGGNKATLTLADGTSILLDDTKNGELAHQANTVISKNEAGQLHYLHSSKATNSELKESLFNTINTPRGGQFQLILSDGTKVWLNSISSLKYPAEFKGNERHVVLTGEAYFEVAKNNKMPFIVNVGKTKVEVLGTHFNVMAYNDEKNSAITLLEGAVMVSNKISTNGIMLKPGQQANIGKDQLINITEADTEQSVAWKDGYFQFSRSNIEDVMKQLSRWYDIEVVFEGDVPKFELVGKIRKSVNLSQVLKILNHSNIKFRKEGRKIIISDE